MAFYFSFPHKKIFFLLSGSILSSSTGYGLENLPSSLVPADEPPARALASSQTVILQEETLPPEESWVQWLDRKCPRWKLYGMVAGVTLGATLLYIHKLKLNKLSFLKGEGEEHTSLLSLIAHKPLCKDNSAPEKSLERAHVLYEEFCMIDGRVTFENLTEENEAKFLKHYQDAGKQGLGEGYEWIAIHYLDKARFLLFKLEEAYDQEAQDPYYKEKQFNEMKGFLKKSLNYAYASFKTYENSKDLDGLERIRRLFEEARDLYYIQTHSVF